MRVDDIPILSEEEYKVWTKEFNALYGSRNLARSVRQQINLVLEFTGAEYPLTLEQAPLVARWLFVIQSRESKKITFDGSKIEIND